MQNPFNFLKKSNDDFGGKYSLHKSVNRVTGNHKITATDGLNLNESSLYLNKGITKRGEKVGETKFIIRNIRDGKENNTHWLNNLLDNPNKYQTGDTFFKLASIYRDATGFAVIKKVTNGSVFNENERVTELHLLNSMGVTINYERSAELKENRIKSFNYTDPVSGLTEEVPFEDTIYWIHPDPKNCLEGMSIIRAGLQSILSEAEIGTQQLSVLKNGGLVDGVMTFKNVLTAEQLKNLKKDYKNEYGNSDNAGLPMFLGGDAQYTRLGLNMNELAYVDSKGLLTKDVIAITGVPSSILGLTSNETFANADASIRIFLRETIKPIVRDLVNTLDWRLAPKDVTIDFEDPTPEDVELKIKKLEIGDKVNALTTNEKREMLGLEPIPDGDEIVRNEKTPEMPTKQKAGIMVHPLKNKEFRAIYHKAHIKSLEQKEARLKSELKQYFKGQEKRLISNINARKQVKKKGLAEEIFDVDLEVSLMTPLLSTIKEIAMDSGQEVMDIFRIDRVFNYSTAIDTAIDKRFNFFSRVVNETTAKEVTKNIDQWLADSGTTADLVDRLKTVYKDVDEHRLVTIANTEASAIKQEATMESYKQIGLKTKIWVWSAGIKGGIRDEHASIDGEERPIDVAFSNGLMYPHDPSASAGDTINCQCSV